MNIFVSYTLRDRILSVSLLRRINTVLSGLGTPYIDLLHNNSIDPQHHVLEMVDLSTVLIACITPRFFQSEWVQEELMMARKRQLPIFYLHMERGWQEGHELEIALRNMYAIRSGIVKNRVSTVTELAREENIACSRTFLNS